PYSYIWNNVAAGNYNLTALATDNTGANTTSSAIYVTVNPGEPQVYYIYTDHLDTPREITDTNGNVVWQWDNTDPFGDNPPNENPSRLGQFEFNLRFPGQSYDKETGLHYNYFRDYDPATGRYVQSDPIGLDGGINTYTYVGGNPLSYTDPLGLANANPANQLGGGFFGGGGGGGRAGGGGRSCPPARVDVDSRGNAFPLREGEYITGSKDGTWKQVRDPQGNPTGMRMDGAHSPNTHTDSRGLQPHAHVPGVTNSDGTPWLPVK
ncbi:MAG: RHS repeat-associated core domain-containing protein, partial [Pseudomonadota bacterium]